jgi:hypothetical protein
MSQVIAQPTPAPKPTSQPPSHSAYVTALLTAADADIAKSNGRNGIPTQARSCFPMPSSAPMTTPAAIKTPAPNDLTRAGPIPPSPCKSPATKKAVADLFAELERDENRSPAAAPRSATSADPTSTKGSSPYSSSKRPAHAADVAKLLADADADITRSKTKAPPPEPVKDLVQLKNGENKKSSPQKSSNSKPAVSSSSTGISENPVLMKSQEKKSIPSSGTEVKMSEAQLEQLIQLSKAQVNHLSKLVLKQVDKESYETARFAVDLLLLVFLVMSIYRLA